MHNEKDFNQKKTKSVIKSFSDDNIIKSYLKEISRYKLLNMQDEIDLSKEIQKGNEKALKTLIKSNLRLVIKIAKSFCSKDYPFIDIIQDGNIGLMRAAKKYDYRKKVRFSTYAAPWIKQMIIRALSQKKRIIRLPYRKEILLKRIKNIKNQSQNIFDKNINTKELSKKLGISEKEIIKTENLEINTYSLDAYLSPEKNITFATTLGTNQYNPYDLLVKKNLIVETNKAIDNLKPKERKVLQQRFGLGEYERKTLKEMGDEFGISAETVRQMETKVIKKIKKNFQYLKKYVS